MLLQLIYFLWQITWGGLQSMIGMVLYLTSGPKSRHYLYHGVIVTEWEKDASVSLGAFVFVSTSFSYIKPGQTKEEMIRRVVVHEYGHTVQSMVLGPFYLLLIGIPSALWANLECFEKKRRAKNRSYYDFFTEQSANKFGTLVTKEKNPSSPTDIFLV